MDTSDDTPPWIIEAVREAPPKPSAAAVRPARIGRGLQPMVDRSVAVLTLVTAVSLLAHAADRPAPREPAPLIIVSSAR